jgi:hypothetical protein
MIGTVAWPVVALVLLAAAVLKAADRTATAVALSVHGVPGRLTAPLWGAAVAAEAGLAAALAAGLPWAPTATAALLAGFAVLQAVALARGGSGAPCGCFGARGRLSRGSLGRTALLAAACAPSPRSARRTRPRSPSPRPSRRAPWSSPSDAGRRLRRSRWSSTARGRRSAHGARWRCPGTASASPSSRRRAAGSAAASARAAELLAAHGVPVRRFDERADAAAWAAAAVPGAPYALAVGPDGTVLAKGTVNDGGQLESVLAAAEARWATTPGAQSEPVEGATDAAGPPSPARRAAASWPGRAASRRR